MNSKLRPEAPVYLPPTRDSTLLKRSFDSSSLLYKPEEPQCSRYSRRSVRYTQSVPNSPRPILGTKMSYLRAILGRKEEKSKFKDEYENVQNDTIEKEDAEEKEGYQIARNFVITVGPMQYDLIKESRYEDTLDYLKNHFHDEPLNVAVGLFEKGQTCEHLEEYDLNTLKDGLSYMATDSGKIAAVALNGISHRGDVQRELERMKSIDDIKFNRLMGLLFTSNADVDLFKKYNVDKIFELRILSVDNDYRGKGLAQKLVEKTEQLAGERGFKLLKMDATSFFTQKICEKFGYKTVKTIVYRDFKDENGKLLYETPAPHETYKIMVKDISRGSEKL